MRGNVCFKRISDTPDVQGASWVKRLWYFLTDEDAESHKRFMALLEISILPLITILSFVVTILPQDANIKADSQVEIVSLDILNDVEHLVFHHSEEAEAAGEEPIYDGPYYVGTYIDIKLRNTGDTVAYLKKVKFEVEEVFPLKDPRQIAFEQVPVSETYDILIDSKPTQTFLISQSVPANGVDRFRLKRTYSQRGRQAP